MRGLLWCGLFCCCLLVAGTAAAQQAAPSHDYRRLTLKLKPGMSEQDVTKLMGEANQSALTTCGQETGKPWQCKILVYAHYSSGIRIIFRQKEPTGDWLVVGWE